MGDDRARGAGANHDPVEIDQTGEDRDRTAEDRDETAAAHDQASEARDQRAEARDDRAEARELAAEGVDTGAAADRAGALRDRRGGASDRTQAADDREAASADRLLSARERAVSSIDELTGAHRRDSGLVELKREIARAKRTKQPLALAFVDVVGLKGTNDSLGHAAGDQLLRATADSIRAHLRSYDLIVRFGGDEFLCALLDVTMAEAAKRFSLVNADLAATHQASVTVGLTELAADDALEDLIARADEAMYRERRQPQSAGARPPMRP
ncbi:MAG: diguanylate cyclase domain-containing protein [Gaiellaceae bacterium]